MSYENEGPVRAGCREIGSSNIRDACVEQKRPLEASLDSLESVADRLVNMIGRLEGRLTNVLDHEPITDSKDSIGLPPTPSNLANRITQVNVKLNILSNTIDNLTQRLQF